MVSFFLERILSLFLSRLYLNIHVSISRLDIEISRMSEIMTKLSLEKKCPYDFSITDTQNVKKLGLSSIKKSVALGQKKYEKSPNANSRVNL